MNFDLKQTLKIAAFATLGFIIYGQAKSLLGIFNEFQKINSEEVKTLAEVLNQNPSKNKKTLQLIKLRPYYSQSLKFNKTIRSAQKYKYEPSDDQQIKNHLQERGFLEYFDLKPKLQWFAVCQNYLQQNSQVVKYERIYGLGKVCGDIFQAKKNIIPKKQLNLIQRFFDWIFLNICGAQGFVQKKQKPSLLWLGPVIGMIQYEINLIKNITIVAACKIQDGKIIPSITATSKSQILRYYQETINTKYLAIGISVIGAIIIGRMIWSDIKKFLNSLKVAQFIMKKGHYEQQVSEDKLCIICYNHCRNMIFFDCRHMILCHQCSQTYESDVCPYCKMEIDDIKPVNGI